MEDEMKYKMFRRIIGKCENCSHWTQIKIGDYLSDSGVCFAYSNQGHFRFLSVRTPDNTVNDKIELNTYKLWGCSGWFPRIGKQTFYHAEKYGEVAE